MAANQSSRGALIGWTVATSILAVTATILAIVFYVGQKNAEEREGTLKTQNAEVYDAAQATGPQAAAVKAAKRPNENLLAASLRLTGEQAALINGQTAPDQAAADAKAALKKATDAVAAANKGAKGQDRAALGTVKTESLVGAVDSLTNLVTGVDGQVAQLTDQLSTAQSEKQQMMQQQQDQLKAKDQQVAEANQKAAAAVAKTDDLQKTYVQNVSDVNSSATTSLDQANESAKQTANQVRDLQNQVAQASDLNRVLQNRLSKFRLPVDQIIKATDASVVQAPSQEKVYISLGSGDQISPGMTFEIFDRNRPIPDPSLKAGAKAAPDSDFKGKAAIEVVTVQSGSSECRVIRKNPGAVIAVGDAVVNLVYSKETPLTFVVYGQFDLNHDNRPSDADADVIRRLVTQWGGKTAAEVKVATDFLVLGSEPAVPNYSQQELDGDPLLRFQRDQAQKQLDAYNAVRDKAVSLSIPVLNQDRFLYFIGYYDLAGR